MYINEFPLRYLYKQEIKFRSQSVFISINSHLELVAGYGMRRKASWGWYWRFHLPSELRDQV